MPTASSRSRRSSRLAVPTMKPAFVPSYLQQGRPWLKFVCPLLALLLIIASFASSRFISKQDGSRLLKNSYGVYTYDIVNEYSHDPKAFTQGLVYAGSDTFYESTGMYGSSSVRRVNVQSGQVLQLHKMEGKYFGEGLTLLNHSLFQVAWKITSGFIYDVDTLSPRGSFRHPMKDGWGLATDGKIIYGSDGTSTIYVMQQSTFKEERRFQVKDQNKEIAQLNELEYIDDRLHCADFA
eukprot:c18763_g1_i1 orf=713-1423(-)